VKLHEKRNFIEVQQGELSKKNSNGGTVKRWRKSRKDSETKQSVRVRIEKVSKGIATARGKSLTGRRWGSETVPTYNGRKAYSLKRRLSW